MAKKRVFGELELAILRIVRSRNRVTVREVQEALEGKDHYTTVMTVMNRLVIKKELQRERVGRHYEYWAESSLPSLSLLERLKQRIFGGRSVAMISHLIETNERLSQEDLEELERLIERAKTRGKTHD